MTQNECDATYCDNCSEELEAGQVDKCEACAKEYDFSELSDSAKAKAREDHTGDGYLDHDWWEYVYEDANRVAKILGLDIESTRVLPKKGTVLTININFSGFSCQGDGACFIGCYEFNEKAVKEMQSYCNDEELIRIAQELTLMQLTQRLKGVESFKATIKTSGNYCHSDTMNCDVTDWGIDEVGEPDEKEFLQLMRDFADWIYATLEKENDWLYSDECVDEALADKKFDVDGGVI